MTGGVLVVDKPAGPTSFDVVKRVRRALGAEKAGHAGTLDPAATGVLAVCVDDAVKLQQWLADGDKAYDATVAFGAATSTEDAEGEVVARGDASGLTADALRAALPRFVGEIDQVPPMYSAVRVDGRRLHEAARAGEEVERAPRRVAIHAPRPPRVRARRRRRRSSGPGSPSAAGRGPTSAPSPPTSAARSVSPPTSPRCAGPRRAGSRSRGRSRSRRRRRSGARTGPRCAPGSSRRRRRSGSCPRSGSTPAEARALAQGKVLHREAPAGDLVRALGAGGELVALCAGSEAGLKPVRVFVTPAQVS